LKLGYTANPTMHHSFGDSNNNELPHITGSFWSSIDRLVITGPNETPPPLKEIFPEDIECRKYRRKGINIDRRNKVGNYQGYIIENKGGDENANNDDRGNKDEVNLDCIYSFSFKTTKIDLELWQIVNIPFLKPMNLTTFWGDADLRLVAYSIPYSNVDHARNKDSSFRSSGSNRNRNFKEGNLNSIKRVEPKKHSQDNIDYIFAVEIQHIFNHPDIIDDIDILSGNSNIEVTKNSSLILQMIRNSEIEHIHVDKSSSENDDNDSDDYFDAIEGDNSLYTFDNIANTMLYNDAIINDDYYQHHNGDVSLDKSDIGTGIESSFVDTATVSFFADTSLMSKSYGDKTPMYESCTDTSPMYESSSCLPRISTFKRHSFDSFIKQKTNNIISTVPAIVTTSFKDAQFFKKSLVIAAIEVESLSSTELNKRRVLYAFRIPIYKSSSLLTSSLSSATGNKYVLRSYGEWSQSSLPLLKIDDIVNNTHQCNSYNNNNNKLLLSKVKDINKRRIRLACSYEYTMKTSNNDNDNNNKLQLELFFSDLHHNQQFLVKYNNNYNSFRSSKKNNFNFTNKSSLSSSLSSPSLLLLASSSSSLSSSYFKEGNVIVQKSNYFWCEFLLGNN
jgi:hypothetical protein